MRERPILFSGSMVRAILEGRKTQTRRILTPELGVGDVPLVRLVGSRSCIYLTDSGLMWRPAGGDPLQPWPKERLPEACPYGRPGDRLWVRETWALEDCPPDGKRAVWEADREAAWLHDLSARFYLPSNHQPGRWRPSIHMPRWASRITLEVTGIRIERLQAITVKDALAEGIAPNPVQEGTWMDYPEGSSASGWRDPRNSFQSFWRSINGAGSWAANPWVWVVEFKRVEVSNA